MSINITKPNLGASNNVWGSQLNTALDAIVTEVNRLGTSGANELAYADNSTGIQTVVSGQLTYTQIHGCGIVVPPTDGPVNIEWEGFAQVINAASGGGVTYLGLMEVPQPNGGTPTLVVSGACSWTTANTGNFSSFLGTIRGSYHLPRVTDYRNFVLSGVNLLDTGSSASVYWANSPTNPTYIKAGRA